MNIEDFRCLKLSFGNFIFYFLSRVKKKKNPAVEIWNFNERKERRKEGKRKKGKNIFLVPISDEIKELSLSMTKSSNISFSIFIRYSSSKLFFEYFTENNTLSRMKRR